MKCVMVDTEEAFIKMEVDLGARRTIALDTETTMLDTFSDKFELVGISLAGDDHTGYYIPVGHKNRPGWEELPPPKQLPIGWVMTRLGRFLEGRRVMGANHKFDRHVFARYNTPMGTTTFDVILAAAVWDSRQTRASLDDLVDQYLGYKTIKIKELCAAVRPKAQAKLPKRKQRMGFEFLTPEEALPYAAADAVNVVRVRNYLAPRLAADPDLSRVYQLEIELLPVVQRMEAVGTKLDEDRVKHLKKRCDQLEAEHLGVLRRLTGYNGENGRPLLNPNSPAQMGSVIYHHMLVPHPKGFKLFENGKAPPKGWLDKEMIDRLIVNIESSPQRANYEGWSRDQVVEFLRAYASYKKVKKFSSTYTMKMIDLVSDDGRLHTEIRQLGAQSGRTASANPNLQNLPRGDEKGMEELDLRAAFVADDGYCLVKADYAAQEMRILAALSQDPMMIAIFSGAKLDEEGNKIDIHAYVGSLAFNEPYLDIVHAVRKKDAIKAGELQGELTKHEKHLINVRQKSKPVNFGIAYGISKYGLAVSAECSVKMAESLIHAWETKAFPHAAAWLNSQPAYLREHLFTRTALGRKRKISAGARQLSEKEWKNVSRPFKNHPIQGTGADMIKQAMIRVDRALRTEFGNDARMQILIHDELIVLCKEEIKGQVKEVLTREMETELYGVSFPVDGELAYNQSKHAA